MEPLIGARSATASRSVFVSPLAPVSLCSPGGILCPERCSASPCWSCSPCPRGAPTGHAHGNVDSADRAAEGRPEAGPPLPAPARVEGDESRQPDPELPQVPHGPGLHRRPAGSRPHRPHQADRAARLDKPDWQILLKLKTDGINLLLPDLQKMRGLATALQERFRDEVAQRRFDDGLRTAKTMFALARHLGEHPTLIGDLVGIAVAFVTIGPLEEMLEQPGCPNLYWALTNLPRPLVPLDKGLEGERVLILSEFHDLDNSTPMSGSDQKVARKHIDLLRNRRKASQAEHAGLAGRADQGHEGCSPARARLVKVGLPEERLLRSRPSRFSSWTSTGSTRCAATTS